MATDSGETLLDIRLPNRVDALPGLLDAIEAQSQRSGWTDQFRTHVLLVIEELVVNSISYGGRTEADGYVTVRLARREDGLLIIISDNGKAYNPFESAPEPTLDLDLDSRAIGGLGVHFVREMTDEQSYARIGDENQASLLKRW